MTIRVRTIRPERKSSKTPSLIDCGFALDLDHVRLNVLGAGYKRLVPVAKMLRGFTTLAPHPYSGVTHVRGDAYARGDVSAGYHDGGVSMFFALHRRMSTRCARSR
jgi:hypothetical protein